MKEFSPHLETLIHNQSRYLHTPFYSRMNGNGSDEPAGAISPFVE
jgi:hypothetical protein